jgi:hypothetical protein
MFTMANGVSDQAMNGRLGVHILFCRGGVSEGWRPDADEVELEPTMFICTIGLHWCLALQGPCTDKADHLGILFGKALVYSHNWLERFFNFPTWSPTPSPMLPHLHQVSNPLIAALLSINTRCIALKRT